MPQKDHDTTHRKAIQTLLRVFVGGMFVWFGLLKLSANTATVSGLPQGVPYFGVAAGGFWLGVLEVLIGVLLLIYIAVSLIEAGLALYVVGVVGAVFAVPEVLFAPQFPVFSVAGELLFKNIVMAIAATAVLLCAEPGSGG